MSIDFKFDQFIKTRYLKPANKYTTWKVAGIVIIGLLLACTMFVFYFIYQYSFLALSNANAIVNLSSTLGADMIDNKNFVDSQNIIGSKKNLPDITNKIRNIFYYVQNTSTTTSTKIN